MMQNKLYAITGGIGSGKSTVAKLVEGNGYTVLSCDEIYAQMLNGGVFNKAFRKSFGDVFYPDGSVDRKKLSQIVFTDESKLHTLNELTHDKVMKEAVKQAKKCLKKNNAPVFIEVQLLFEEGYQKYFDRVIVVRRDKEKRVTAVMERSALTREQVLARMLSQIDYDTFDFSQCIQLYNNGSLLELTKNVNTMLKNLVFEN